MVHPRGRLLFDRDSVHGGHAVLAVSTMTQLPLPSSQPGVREAIETAERLLPGIGVPRGWSDPRWRAIVRIAEFVESHPEQVWRFVRRWGCHSDAELRSAIAIGLLEHLIGHHFELIFPRVERLAGSDPRFADTFRQCWKLWQSNWPENSIAFDRLMESLAAPGCFERLNAGG